MVWGLTVEKGVGWAEEGEGENWDSCNRIIIKYLIKNYESSITYEYLAGQDKNDR